MDLSGIKPLTTAPNCASLVRRPILRFARAAKSVFIPGTLPVLNSLLRWLPLALIALIALWLRTHDLSRRPMHADEANQAVKTGELLETGRYVFDPRDHHGPTLYYATLPLAWLRGERTLAALSETTVRFVPALFGTLAVLLVAMLAAPLGRWPTLAAAAFVALSPPAVYYCRYFIQETLLLAFTLATFVVARKWWTSRRTAWAIATGICVGLMLATKASAPLFLAATSIALLAFVVPPSGSSETRSRLKAELQTKRAALAFTAAIFTAAVLYSSFFTRPVGIRDAFVSFIHGFTRATGETGHEKPWWYYLQLFGWQREGGLIWHQAAFSALALGGLLLGCRSLRAGDVGGALRPDSAGAPQSRGIKPLPQPSSARRLLPITALYTLLIAGILSLTPYKTPWHAIHLVPGMAVLAAGALAAVASLRTGKVVAVLFAFVALLTLASQAWRAAFLRPADQRNPYAYVHSSPDVLKYRAFAEAALVRAPDQPIRVIGEEYWPLPWYLRGLPNVGYWSAPPADCDGALVIVSASQADAVRARFKQTYRESLLGLRPGVILAVFTPES